MGLHDAEEMLEAAKAQSIADERTIADLQRRLDQIATLALDVAGDTRVQVLALAADIEPEEAYRRLRVASGLPVAVEPDDATHIDDEEDPTA